MGFVTEYIAPVKIFATHGKIENINNLLIKRDLQICVEESEVCTVNGKGFIVFDFGMEYNGGARILTHVTSKSAVKVRLRFGESVAETYTEVGEKGACNDHSLRDFETMLTSYSDMTFGQTGFRFLRIDFLEDVSLTLKNVYCAYTHRVFPEAIPFASGDSRIENIYSVAKRTIELCCQTYLWDGIKRDRLVWIGDTHPEMLALTSLYSRAPIVEEALDITARQFPLGTWMNNIPMYSAWWVIIIADYCAITGTFDLVDRYRDYVEGIIAQCDDCVKDNGELDFPYYFVDWPTHEQPDELAGCRALFTIMVNKALEIEKSAKLDTTRVKSLKAKLEKMPIEVKTSKQVIALKYLATGKITEEERQTILAGGAKGMSTFMSYYIVKTVAEIHSPEYAIQMMKDYYGAMLDKGATTFFEDFDMDWVENSNCLYELPKEGQRDIHGDFGKYCYIGFRHSFCHGWSAGVIKFLYEYCNEK
ncbi:MAG: hypothetical protein IJV67_03625 [Clostridia bacterium]|nr:hypothetical protein [Clostridia bacterium]